VRAPNQAGRRSESGILVFRFKIIDCTVTDVSKSAPKIAGMFDAIAARYDFLNHFLSAGIDRHWRTQAVRSLRLTGSECVLDLCTGTGDLAIALRTGHPGAARVVGVDFAAAMLAMSLHKVRRRGLADRVQLVRADATRVPLSSGSTDAVTIAFGIRNVEDPEAACREMLRVLVPGGRLAILEFAVPSSPLVRSVYMSYFKHVLPRLGRLISRHDTAYEYLPASVGAFASPAEFASLLRGAGFVDVSIRTLTAGVVVLFSARKP
jgi:demethylmenaquinone methyltransferase / 2-methoxy-6-polyprenyl-1,4-benzoquinol methylase